MSRRTATIDLKGNRYAKVSDRIKEFRTDNPRSKIQTDHTYLDDGMVEFRAWIWRDKANLIDLMMAGITDKETLQDSADANGTAKKITKDEKDFEKLETIAVGRALALLGYLASGEIASFEEMEEFRSFQDDRLAEEIQGHVDTINSINDLDKLREYFVSLGTLMTNEEVVKAKDAKKAELSS